MHTSPSRTPRARKTNGVPGRTRPHAKTRVRRAAKRSERHAALREALAEI
jgi:hypothetical protein